MKNNKNNAKTVSIDSEEIQVRNHGDFYVWRDLYTPNGWIGDKVIYPNSEYSNETRIVDKTNLSRDLFHTSLHGGFSYKYKGKIRTSKRSILFKIAGLLSYRKLSDRLKCQARDKIVEYLKSSGANYKYKKIDVAFDMELEDIKKYDIDNFFLLQLSKSVKINSPFKYFEKDGSRTYYLLSTIDPIIDTYLYLKHVKEGLRRRFILRLEISYNKLTDFGDNPDKIINYIEQDLKTKKLLFFENVDAGNSFKQHYQNNIQENIQRNNIKKSKSDNVPKMLLRKIKSKADDEFELVLSDEIKDHIRHVLTREETKKVELEPTRKALTTPIRKDNIGKME